jgi:hypothetical protein
MVIHEPFLFFFAQNLAPAISAGEKVVKGETTAVYIGTRVAVQGGTCLIKKIF